jgi:hypothetical protein
MSSLKPYTRLTLADLLAYGLSTCFVLAGLFTLAVGDSRIGATRYIHTPVDIVGRDRILFGFALLAAGYLLFRWLFRTRGIGRRWGIELQVLTAFAVAGYVAYRLGLAS